jgi:hypothetical protein
LAIDPFSLIGFDSSILFGSFFYRLRRLPSRRHLRARRAPALPHDERAAESLFGLDGFRQRQRFLFGGEPADVDSVYGAASCNGFDGVGLVAFITQFLDEIRSV